MKTVLRVILHIAIFLVALFVFYLGIGIGLSRDPTIGTILWIVAGVIGVGNLVWIVMSFRKAGRTT